MGSRLNELCKDIGNSTFFTEEYLTYITTHLKFIREHSSTQIHTVDNQLVHKNMSDFFGLFMDMGIRYEDHQLLMMVNGILDPLDLTEEFTTLILPDGDLIDRLKLLFRTTTV
jgi:hypothetical protein